MKKYLWLALAPGLMSAQTDASSAFNPLNAQGLFRLQGVSVFSGYYTSGAPSGFEVPVASPFLAGPSASGGITATFGGSVQGEKSTFSWTYSPSYFNTFYSNNAFSSNGSLNHRLGINWSRKLGAKWTLSSSVNGMMANLQQLYFNPSLLSTVAALPTSFDDLAAGMLTGKFTDAQFAALLTGAPLTASPEQGYLYGTRILDLGANMGLSWAATGRTSFSFSASGGRVQNFNEAGTSGGITAGPTGSFLPQMTSGSASFSWSYSLSPRTQIGASISTSHAFSSLQRGFASNGGVSIGRTMSRRWFLQGQAGFGRMDYSHQTYAAPSSVQYLYSGSVGFKMQTQTFLASYNRSLGDSYGLGSGSTSAASGAWSWKHPGSTWSISAGGGYQQLNNSTFSNTRSWSASAGISKAWGQHFSSSVQCMYFQFPSNFKMAGFDGSEKGVSVGMNWSPPSYR